MRIKEIEARLAAIKQEIEQRGDAMTAAEIDALEQETTQLTEERAGLIAAAEKRNGILDNLAKGAGIVSRSFQQNNGDGNAAPGRSLRYARISFRVAEKHSPPSAERRRESAHSATPAARVRRLSRRRPRTIDYQIL